MNNKQSSLTKENLVMCGGIGGGKHTVQGLIDLLSEYFNVFYLDLPGSGKEDKPLQNFLIMDLSEDFKRRLEKLNLDSYILAGGSLGFRVVNQLPYNKKCKGIFAIVPYLNSRYLNYPIFKKMILSVQLNLISYLKLYSIVWKSKYFRTVTIKTYGEKAANAIFDGTDPYTFFEAVRFVLSDISTIKFHDYPYVLIASVKDNFLNFEKVVKYFQQDVSRLLELKTKTDHYPVDASKYYYEANFPKSGMNQIVEFLQKNRIK